MCVVEGASSVCLWIFCGNGCFVGLQVWSFWPRRPQDQWVKFGFGSLAVRLSWLGPALPWLLGKREAEVRES